MTTGASGSNGDSAGPFSPYAEYVRSLDGLLGLPQHGWRPEVERHLDGGAQSELRRLIPSHVRHQHGTFFTPSALRNRLVAPYRTLIQRGRDVVDPACGAGDLLLSAGNLLPADKRFPSRVATQFHGVEIHRELVDVSKRRLALQARVRGGHPSWGPDRFDVRHGDGLDTPLIEEAGIILVNPPFTQMSTESHPGWAGSKMSVAAHFVSVIVSRARTGAKVGAILPDVLRNGQRYQGWRQSIGGMASVDGIVPLGRFDTDVSAGVFALHLTKCESATRMWPGEHRSSRVDGTEQTLGDLVDVSVGAVVPHRASDNGPSTPYLDVPGVPIGRELGNVVDRRPWIGKTHGGPFILVRRTSKPGAVAPRLLTSTYSGTEDVAIENHLIVLQPKPESSLDLTELARLLGRREVSTWLNERSHTRHVPARLVGSIPLDVLGGDLG